VIPETISAEHAASLVKSGMWLDYGVSNCQPDVFDKALARISHKALAKSR
jgi:acyl-CoA hydrolase